VILKASILRIDINWQVTNVKLHDDDRKMLKHVNLLCATYFPSMHTFYQIDKHYVGYISSKIFNDTNV